MLHIDKLNKICLYVILILATVIMIGPFIWLVFSSLKLQQDMYTIYPALIARSRETGKLYITFQNYSDSFQYLDFLNLFKNTLLVALINTFINLFLNSMAGYAFARLNFPGRDKIFKFTLISLMVPGTVLLIPNVILVKMMGIYNTRAALIIPFIMSVYNVFMMRQFFFGIPVSLEEAARVDGAGRFRIFFQIALPLVKPALVTLGIFTFLWNYNNFLWPLVVLTDQQKFTLPIGLASLITAGFSKYNVLVAGSVVVALPLILIYVIFQRYISEGIIAGSIKG
jgi:ABC-type glycerol-3-phosphate transport system permease component